MDSTLILTREETYASIINADVIEQKIGVWSNVNGKESPTINKTPNCLEYLSLTHNYLHNTKYKLKIALRLFEEKVHGFFE